MLTTKARIPPLYLIIAGSCFQFLGVGLLCSLSPTPMLEQRKQYGFEVIAGVGFGLVLTSLLTLIPLVVEVKDMPVVIGAVTQVRVLGGTIGLAISTTVLNGFVKQRLQAFLSLEEANSVGDSLQEIRKLTRDQQTSVRGIFAEGYQRQMYMLTGFSGLVFMSSLLMWERKPRRHNIGEDPANTEREG